MKGIIDNIITFYSIQAKARSILIANTQKALEQSEKERKINEQTQRIENFVKDLIMNLNNMLTKFHFLKERKNRKQEQFTVGQTKAITEFAVLVKSLTGNVSSLLKRFQAEGTFEEKIDKEMKGLEVSVRQKLKEIDKALDETKDTLTNCIISSAQNIVSSFTKLIQVQRTFLPNSRKADGLLEESTQNTSQDSPARIQDSGADQLEDLFNCSDIKSITSHNRKSKFLMDLKV